MFVEGALQNIASAILYSWYGIALNAEARKCPTLDYGLYLGFVGVFNLILLSPCILALHLTNIEPVAVPSFEEFASQFGYALLSSFCAEFVWAKATTLLGPITSTIWFTAVTLPTIILIDFVIWPDPNSRLTLIYICGMLLVLVSFFIIGFTQDRPKDQLAIELADTERSESNIH